MKYLTKNENQTFALGKKLAHQLKGSKIIGLVGPLGAGKTIFIKGLTAGLNIKKIITSPSFVLMKIYPIKSKKNKQLVHIDCYRLKSAKELINIGIEDYLKKPNTIVVIEWADKIKKILPADTIWVKIKLGKKENQRMVDIIKTQAKKVKNL